MATYHRYIKGTIKNQHWELTLKNDNGKYRLLEAHVSKSGRVIKKKEKTLSAVEAKAYMKLNKKYLVEEYTSK